MGAVEEAQIRAAAAEAGRVAPEADGIVRAVSRLLGMVADDLTQVVEELEGHEADTTLAHHALGVVTGALGVLDGMAPPPRIEVTRVTAVEVSGE